MPQSYWNTHFAGLSKNYGYNTSTRTIINANICSLVIVLHHTNITSTHY